MNANSSSSGQKYCCMEILGAIISLLVPFSKFGITVSFVAPINFYNKI
jgi:hypothetical protein